MTEPPGTPSPLTLEVDILAAMSLVMRQRYTETGVKSAALILGWRTYLEASLFLRRRMEGLGTIGDTWALREWEGIPVVVDGTVEHRIYVAPPLEFAHYDEWRK